MYIINNQNKFPFILPIDLIQNRLNLLRTTNRIVIIYIKNEFDNSTFRYRFYNFIQALNHSHDENYALIPFESQELEMVVPYLDKIKLVVFQRAYWCTSINNALLRFKSLGIPITYDIDDLIYHPKYIPLYLNNINKLNDYNTSTLQESLFAYAAKISCIITECDAMICSNHFLSKKMKQDLNKPVYVVGNFLNDEQIIISNATLKERIYIPENFYIGYFSGSPSHNRDFSIAAEQIFSLMEKYNNIYLKVVGFIDFSSYHISEQVRNRIITIPLRPYQELQYEIASVDLNIVPLVVNDFNNSKSELKFFEASLLDTVTCASPTFAYKSVIRDGENGFICQEDEWFSKIEDIYLNKCDLNKIIKNIQNEKNHYYPSQYTNIIINTFSELIKMG